MYGLLRSWKQRPENGATQVMRWRIVRSVLLTAPIDRHWLWALTMVCRGRNEPSRVPRSRHKRKGARRVLQNTKMRPVKGRYRRWRGLTARNNYRHRRA